MDRPAASPEPLVAKVVRKYKAKRTNQSRHPTMWNSWGELDKDSVVSDFYCGAETTRSSSSVFGCSGSYIERIKSAMHQ